MTVSRTAVQPDTSPLPGRTPPGVRIRAGRTIEGWDPENREQWNHGGRRVADTNLRWSVLAEFLGFAVWGLWSIIVPQLNKVGFALTVDQMFWLISVPSLVGATLRIPYTFAVPRFGGRNWTIVSAALLVAPVIGLHFAVQSPGIGFGWLLLIASLAGLGGGNFASSMANISFFYPLEAKGRALGLNAAGGNLGTAAVQFGVPLLVVTGAGLHLERAGLVFLPLIALAIAGACWRMHNLAEMSSGGGGFAAAARSRHTWIIAFIYIGTFGSFIGFAGAFPTLLASIFPDLGLSIAFLGALVGSIARPVGGVLADRVGGARLTIWSFLAMIGGAVGANLGIGQHNFLLFFCSFIWLFLFTGIGNGAVYAMIPRVFAVQARANGSSAGHARQAAAGCIGIAGAVGAFGGFAIPRGFAASTQLTGGVQAAIWTFVGIYAVMALITAVSYLRPAGTAPGGSGEAR